MQMTEFRAEHPVNYPKLSSLRPALELCLGRIGVNSRCFKTPSRPQKLLNNPIYDEVPVDLNSRTISRCRSPSLHRV